MVFAPWTHKLPLMELGEKKLTFDFLKSNPNQISLPSGLLGIFFLVVIYLIQMMALILT